MGNKVKSETKFSDIMEEMKLGENSEDEVLMLDAKDKLFIGGGCEELKVTFDGDVSRDDIQGPINLSICTGFDGTS